MPRGIYGQNELYPFKDQDPCFNQMRTIWRASGMNLNALADELRMSRSTLYSWFVSGATHSPRHESLQIFYHYFDIEYGARSNLRVVVEHAKRAGKKAA